MKRFAYALSILVACLVVFVAGMRSVAEAAPVPGPSIIMTFDDSHSSLVNEALPRMEPYGYKGVAMVVAGKYGALSDAADPG